MQHTTIKYLTRAELDTGKWDACISQSTNGLIYAKSSYLDIMARQWDALVMGDYEAVMPLTWNRKWGFDYLYQPSFTAMLGIFGNQLSSGTVSAFIKQIPEKFRLIEIELNPGNPMPLPSTAINQRLNYTLGLSASYETLRNNFRENVKRNCKKALELDCTYKTGVDIDAILQLAEQQLITRKEADPEGVGRFRKLFETLKTENACTACGVFNHKGDLLASAVFIEDERRYTYILAGNHPDSKTYGASHLLIDRFIESHAGSGRLLDFEGSDHRNLAFFYSSFGATAETYPSLRINRLPWWVKWLKK